jgi:DNA modification methylase
LIISYFIKSVKRFCDQFRNEFFMIQNQVVNLADLQPHPANYNRHSEAQIAKLAKSLQTFGQVRSVVVWRNTILAGHGVVLAALSLGWTEIRADDVSHLSEDEALAYVVADNELARQSDPDQAQLAAILEELQAREPQLVTAAGYSTAELEQLLRLVRPQEPVDAEPQIDRAEELRVKWGTATGQLWAFGEHRLICGDCTDAGVVARLMAGERAALVFTDPPYGVDYEGGLNDKKRTKIEGDKSGDLYLPGLKSLAAICKEDAPMYIWFAASVGKPVYYAVDAIGYSVRAMIVWNKLKAHYGNFMAQYMQKHEPCLYIVRGNASWIGPTDEVTVWDIDQPSVNEYHPTQKPLALALRAIGNHDANIVADFFAGSGTTGIACQNLGRRARMVEISPAYCAVILERFAAIGVVPELLESAPAILEGA